MPASETGSPSVPPYAPGLIAASLALASSTWCLAWMRPSLDSGQDAWLTVICLAVLGSSLALRGWVVRRREQFDRAHHPWERELIWGSNWLALANVLALAFQIGTTAMTAVPALLVFLVAESFMFALAPVGFRNLVHQWFFRPTPRAAVFSKERDGCEMDGWEADYVANEAYEEEASEEAAGFRTLGTDHRTRVMIEEIAESGDRILRGWVRFSVADGDPAISLTIGFSPAFADDPELEIDCETIQQHASLEGSAESMFEARIEQVTPCGARIAIRRGNASEQATGILSWHASAAELAGGHRESSYAAELAAKSLP